MSEQSWIVQNFVWYSRQQGRDGDKISFVACMEVVLSVAAYWTIALYFETYAHLLVSICLAPLVLLRSDDSVELGLRWYKRYRDVSGDNLPMRPPKVLAAIAISFAFAFGFAWFGLSWATVGQKGLSLFLWSSLIGWLAINIGIAVAVMGVGVGAVVRAMAMVVVGMRVRAIAAVIIIVGVGVALGYLSRTIGIRVVASALHLRRGIFSLPKNWTRTLFRTDFTQAPELVPGANTQEIGLRLNNLWKPLLKDDDVLRGIVTAALLRILFIPALLYRYSIKSTCWLYLPLIYVAHAVPKDRMGWVKDSGEVLWEKLRIVLAGITVVVVGYSILDTEAAQGLMKARSAAEIPFHPLQILLVLEWSRLLPWQWFNLSSATLTLYLWVHNQRLRVRHKRRPYTDTALPVRVAVWLNGVRAFCVICWLAIALYCTVGLFLSTCDLPPWMVWTLTLHFPTPAC